MLKLKSIKKSRRLLNNYFPILRTMTKHCAHHYWYSNKDTFLSRKERVGMLEQDWISNMISTTFQFQRPSEGGSYWWALEASDSAKALLAKWNRRKSQVINRGFLAVLLLHSLSEDSLRVNIQLTPWAKRSRKTLLFHLLHLLSFVRTLKMKGWFCRSHQPPEVALRIRHKRERQEAPLTL